MTILRLISDEASVKKIDSKIISPALLLFNFAFTCLRLYFEKENIYELDTESKKLILNFQFLITLVSFV